MATIWLSLNPREGPKEGFEYSFESEHAVKAAKVSMETVFRKKRGMIQAPGKYHMLIIKSVDGSVLAELKLALSHFF